MVQELYVVKLNNKEVSPRVASPALASHYIGHLMINEQTHAKICKVDENGKEILLG